MQLLEDPNRRGSWLYRDLKSALEAAEADLVSQKGSHRTFKHPEYRELVTLVDKRNEPLPYGYVRDVIRLLIAVIDKEA